MPDVTMPRLSDSMEEGTILRWLRHAGDPVRRGDELVEIETDKATETCVAQADGILEVVAREGTTLPVGAVIARLADAERAPASPLARRLAREGGIDLQVVRGTGPGGRIVGADIAAAAAAAAAAEPERHEPAAASAPAPGAEGAAGAGSGGAKGDVTILEPSRTRALVARRVAEARATVPEYTLRCEADMEPALAALAQLSLLALPVVPGIADVVLRACALALRDVPQANASYRDARYERYARINVGMTIAAQGTLVSPTIFDADRKALAELAREARVLAAGAHDGSLASPQLGNATFSVYDAGPDGPDELTPVIVTPQAATLGVGAVAPRIVARDGAPAVAHTARLTLVCDHRILHGADADLLLRRIRTWIEHPAALLAAR
ncbi:2-oxo acid dehydrogenase subunit E2 [Baekduia soli]|uniref:Dihydrolipoamide acetyltransferase component of pyruvate dehydrogenase complex n=1 Tax=Baekduia soli TaxID=496014 RepID=A0A5B8U1V8_9ACTN|nr:dihydrolipoamide acetyltransferase family protein [Baekduia soli]QEC46948.1 2-oxo acid dehydrogenase subunit E2 [Baekduia soli]